MEISGAHQQAMASHGLEEILGSCSNQPQPERKPRTQAEQALKCPRCDSTNTKFCYYNNYSLSQPRYFCKGCRRYWTKGGSLRNVPVGGGCRKNKRSSSSSSSSNLNSNSLKSRPQGHQSFISSNSIPPLPSLPPSLPPISYEHSDLTLAFARLQNHQQHQWPVADLETFLIGNPNPNPVPGVGFLNIMRSGFVENGVRNGFHNFYSGYSGSCSAVEDVEGSTTTTGGQEVLLPLENSSTAGKGGDGIISSEGWCKAVGGGESKVLMGLQWPIGMDGGMGMEWVLH